MKTMPFMVYAQTSLILLKCITTRWSGLNSVLPPSPHCQQLQQSFTFPDHVPYINIQIIPILQTASTPAPIPGAKYNLPYFCLIGWVIYSFLIFQHSFICYHHYPIQYFMLILNCSTSILLKTTADCSLSIPSTFRLLFLISNDYSHAICAHTLKSPWILYCA